LVTLSLRREKVRERVREGERERESGRIHPNATLCLFNREKEAEKVRK